MALGTGSAIAHRAVDAVMGPRVVTHETVAAPAMAAAAPIEASADRCSHFQREFANCVKEASKCSG